MKRPGGSAAPSLRLTQRLATALLTSVMLAFLLCWIVAAQVGVIQASRDFLPIWIGGFAVAALLAPSRGSLAANLLPGGAVVILTCGIAVAVRVLVAPEAPPSMLADWLALAGRGVVLTPLVALVYRGAHRAAQRRAERRPPPPETEPASGNDRLSIAIWWSLSAAVCVWLPLMLVLQVLEFGYELRLSEASEERLTFAVLFGCGALVCGLGLLGLLPGTSRAKR